MATKRTTWTGLAAPLTERGRAAYGDEARISEFREFVFRLRTEAGLTQGELASRMGTTQSAMRMAIAVAATVISAATMGAQATAR